MKLVSLFTLTFLATSLSLSSQVLQIVQQDALDSIAPGECLVAAAALANENGIRIELKTNGPSTSWVHVFINIDGDENTGFEHYKGGASAKGLDLMLESDIAYRFSGVTPVEWSWAQQANWSLTKTIEDDVIILMLNAPGLEISEHTKLLAVTYSSDYAVAQDHLPRSPTQTWMLTKESLTSSSQLQQPALIEKKNDH